MTGDIKAPRSPLQKFADARRILGVTALPMRDDERPKQVVIADRCITVILSVARWSPVRGGVKVTHRGERWLSFEWNDCDQRWVKVVVSDTTARLVEPELHLSSAPSEAEQVAREAHEAMCYRPGTRSYPMDGPARLAEMQRVYA